MTVRYVTSNSRHLDFLEDREDIFSEPSMPCKKACLPLRKYAKTIIYSLLMTIVFLVVSTYLMSSKSEEISSSGVIPQPLHPQNVCLTEKCIRSAAIILKMIDKNVDPCDDFYKFVCGNFIKNTVVPDDKTVVNTFSLTNDKVKRQLKTLLDEPLRSEDTKPLKLLKTVYKSCMNTTQLETEALSFIKKIFKELGGWPVIESSWNERKFDWKNLLYRLRRIGWNFNIFVKMQIDLDLRNSSKRILAISQPYISNYQALKRGINDSETQAYYEYMVKMVSLFGAPTLSANVEMNEVLEFEINLSKIIIPYSGRRNISSEYNPTTIKKLQEKVHGLPWLQLINNFLAPIEMLTSKDVINVSFPKFLRDLEDLLLSTKKRILANYLFWYIIKNSVTHLPQRFRYEALEYHKIVKGLSRHESRWEQCIKEVDKLHVAASSLYVKKFFDNRNKKAVTEIAAYVKDAFIETLKEVNWMDPETKKRALFKAEKIELFIAFPDEVLNDEKVEEYYKGLELDPRNHYLKINLNLSSFLHKKKVKKLKAPVDKSDWAFRSYSYNANGFYNQKSNAIEVMAALMQDHFFHIDRPQYLNFASIGEVIGHEILHGFDDEGRQYDEKGNLAEWWDLKTLQIFSKKSNCLINQYENETVPEIGKKINGINTLDENIADNGGFKVAYKGYLKWIEKNKEGPTLPGLSYTPRQLFWISAASDGCAKYKKEALKRFVILGRHAPEYFRILVPFRNSEDFSRDFNCSVGDGMNPEKKCQVW